MKAREEELATTRIPLVDLKAQYREIRAEIDAAIGRVLESGRFILGEEVSEFEREFAHSIGVRGAIGVASGTAALHLALVACGIGPGDEVITPANTFVSVAEVISHVGARPVYVDIDLGTYAIDPSLVEQAITERTRAIIPVHLYGHPADMGALRDIANAHGLALIEDSAQAHGAYLGGVACGGFGDLACFSFYPGKNLGAFGDAGALAGSNEELLARVRSLRDHGRSTKYEHAAVGYSERMDALQAAVLRVKLRHLADWVQRRRARAGRYSERLSRRVHTPTEAPNAHHAYHLYVVRTPNRDALLEHLRAHNIEAGIHYPIPLYRQPAYAAAAAAVASLPNTERSSREVLSLPLYPEITEAQVDAVSQFVEEFTS